MENKYEHHDLERTDSLVGTDKHEGMDAIEGMDALDKLIADELGQQERLRNMMQSWETRKRAQRRSRLIPFISNILSVAALMIAGLIIHALVPKTTIASSSAEEYRPLIDYVVGGHAEPAATPVVPTDSAETEP